MTKERDFIPPELRAKISSCAIEAAYHLEKRAKSGQLGSVDDSIEGVYLFLLTLAGEHFLSEREVERTMLRIAPILTRSDRAPRRGKKK